MVFDRDDRGLFKKGDVVINKDKFHRYYNQKGVITCLVGLRQSYEDQSQFPKLKKGVYLFQQFKVAYNNRETQLLTDSEHFVKY